MSETDSGRYDHLFESGPEVLPPSRESLPALTEYQLLIFEPIVQPELPAKPINYDWLFDDSIPPPVGPRRTKQESGRHPDSKSEEEAMMIMEDPGVDPVIEKIIDLYSSHKLSPLDKVHMLQQNPEARRHLAAYFLDKMNKSFRGLPRRVLVNTQKSTNFPGYNYKMTSREYASLLAISMLDGSFKTDLESSDPIDEKAQRGQHRTAARRLLSRN